MPPRMALRWPPCSWHHRGWPRLRRRTPGRNSSKRCCTSAALASGSSADPRTSASPSLTDWASAARRRSLIRTIYCPKPCCSRASASWTGLNARASSQRFAFGRLASPCWGSAGGRPQSLMRQAPSVGRRPSCSALRRPSSERSRRAPLRPRNAHWRRDQAQSRPRILGGKTASSTTRCASSWKARGCARHSSPDRRAQERPRSSRPLPSIAPRASVRTSSTSALTGSWLTAFTAFRVASTSPFCCWN